MFPANHRPAGLDGQSPTVTTARRSYVLALFGLPFFLVGAGILLLSVVPTLYDVWRMQSWPSVNGTLTHAALGSSTSDGATTYHAEAHYNYSVLGTSFSNDRVAINSGADNISDFQLDLGNQLEDLFKNNYPVTVFYDPENPADAVLNRDLRWWLLGFKLIFVVLFGGAGAGIMYWGLRGRKTIITPEAIEKPWLTRPEWQQGIIRSDARGGMKFLWVFAILWNLISAPAAFMFMEVWNEEGAVALLILLFPLVGVLMLWLAIKSTREWKRFGVTPLTLDPFPGSIGGDVAGEIQTNIPYRSDRVCRVTLSSINSYMSGSGKNRSRKENIKWQDDGYARVIPATNGVTLQFRFKVPEGLEETEEATGNYHLWRLNVELSLDGTDFDRSFELPVYRTGQTSNKISMESASEQPVGVPRITAESLLPLSYEGVATLLYYPMFRKPGRSLGLILFGGIFAGVGAFLWQQAAEEGFMLYLMASLFGLVGWGTILAGIYSALNALRVRMDGFRISSVRSLAGIPISSHEILYGEILAVEAREGMKSNSGKKHKIEYSVVARTQDKRITLAEQLDSTSKRDLVIKYFQGVFQ